jgi:hypothetical protein
LSLSVKHAIEVFSEAVAEAGAVGLHWMNEPLVLRPTSELVELIRRSQEVQAQGGGEGEAE